MKTEINTDLQIFVTQKKTDGRIKNYYLTYRKDGVSYHKQYITYADLLAELNGLNLMAGTWLIPNINGGGPVSYPELLDGETSIPDDEEVKTVFSYKAIFSSLTLAGTQPIVLVILKGAGIEPQQAILLTLGGSESIKNFTNQLLDSQYVSHPVQPEQ